MLIANAFASLSQDNLDTFCKLSVHSACHELNGSKLMSAPLEIVTKDRRLNRLVNHAG